MKKLLLIWGFSCSVCLGQPPDPPHGEGHNGGSNGNGHISHGNGNGYGHTETSPIGGGEAVLIIFAIIYTIKNRENGKN